VVSLFLLFLTWSPEIGRAQPAVNDKAPKTVVAPGARPKAVTAGSVEALSTQIKEDKSLEESVRSQALDFCKQALDEIQRAEGLTQRIARDQRDALDIKGRNKELKHQADAMRDALAEMSNQPIRDLPSEISLEAAEGRLVRKQGEARTAREDLEKWKGIEALRPTRRKELQDALTALNDRLRMLLGNFEAPAAEKEPSLLTQARRAMQVARYYSTDLEIASTKAEIERMELEQTSGHLPLRTDMLSQKALLAEKELEVLNEQVSRLRRKDAERRVSTARQEAYAAARLNPRLSVEAEKNETYARAAQELSEKTETTATLLKGTQQDLTQMRQQFTRTKEKIESAGLNGAVGILLRKQRTTLPDPARYRRSSGQRHELLADVEYARLEMQDERDRLTNVEPLVRQILSTPASDEVDRETLENAARETLDKQREYLNVLLKNYDAYFATLSELDSVERQYVAQIVEYAGYIDERVLWIRSDRPLTDVDYGRAGRSAWSLLEWGQWSAVVTIAWEDLKHNPIPVLLVVILFALVMRFRREVKVRLATSGEIASRSTTYSFAPTAQALLLTALVSLIVPGLFWFLAWRLEMAVESVAGDVLGRTEALALAEGMIACAQAYAILELVRQLLRHKGLAEAHFGWPERSLTLLRGSIRLLLIAGLPFLFLNVVIHRMAPDLGRETIERYMFLASMAVLMLFFHRVLQPTTGVVSEYLAQNRRGWNDRLKWVWYAIGLLAPLALATLTATGYYYTARQLSLRLGLTALLVTALIFVRGVLLRWELVRRRKVWIQRARERRTAGPPVVPPTQTPEAAPSPAEAAQLTPQQAAQEDKAVLTVIGSQISRLLTSAVVAIGIVGVWMVWVDVLPSLKRFNRWPLWYTTVTVTERPPGSGESAAVTARTTERSEPITVADLAIAILVGVLTLVAAKNLPGVIELSLLQRLPLDAAGRYAITRVFSYLLTFVGVVVGFGMIGIGWSKIQWLATALTFGLAFGLQEIFANFVSGLIILFERPIRVGDVVTIGDVTGSVSRIRIRATTITNWELKELVVPNKEFITGKVLNWTLSNTRNRVQLEVGVGYGSDIQQVRELLLGVVAANPAVLKDPQPWVGFEAFGDNSLIFRIRVYFGAMDVRLETTHLLNTAIYNVLRENGIEISFPQRDLHIRSLPPELTDHLMSSHPASSAPKA